MRTDSTAVGQTKDAYLDEIHQVVFTTKIGEKHKTNKPINESYRENNAFPVCQL